MAIKPTPYEELLGHVRQSPRFRILSLHPYVAEGRIAMPYRYFAGPVARRFFAALRDEGRILGVRCEGCGTVYVPPPSVCGPCFREPGQWVKLNARGRLLSHATPSYHLPIHPSDRPPTYGLVLLEGADTPFVHLLGECTRSDLRPGLRVEAVFREKREGNILDIQYFRPLH